MIRISDFPVRIGGLSIRIITAMLLFAMVLPSFLPAQSDEAPPTVQVAAVSLLDTPPPSLFFRDSDDNLNPFIIAQGSRSRYNNVPVGDFLQLYRRESNQAGEMVAVPAVRLKLDRAKDPTLFIFHVDHKGKSGIRRLSANEDSHPKGSVALLNLCGRSIAVILGNERILLANDEFRTINIDTETTFSFTWAYQREGMKPYQSATQRLRFFQQDQRLLIPFAGNSQTVQSESGKMKKAIFPNAFRLYDTPPVPPES